MAIIVRLLLVVGAFCLLLRAEAASYQSAAPSGGAAQQTQFAGLNPGGYAPTRDNVNAVKELKHANAYEEEGVLERFNHRYPDGSYEFRYELADGTARYERGYFLLFNKVKTLVVVGYYSYRMNDGRYLTVFYNADQHGYRQNQSITKQVYPDLPRSIDVPKFTGTSNEASAAPQAPPAPPAYQTTTQRYYPTTTHRGFASNKF